MKIMLPSPPKMKMLPLTGSIPKQRTTREKAGNTSRIKMFYQIYVRPDLVFSSC